MDYIETIAKYLYEEYEEAYDTIPTDFNFIDNTYAIELKIAENITDNYYKDDISLQVRVVGLVENKYKIINKSLTLLEELNKLDIIIDNYSYRIIKENVPYTSYTDEDKFNSVLMLNIIKYNEYNE